MLYGQSQEEAISKVKALALRVLAEQLEHGEEIPELNELFVVPACVHDHQRKHAWCYPPYCE